MLVDWSFCVLHVYRSLGGPKVNIKSFRIGVKGSCEAKGALRRAESRLSTRLVNMLSHSYSPRKVSQYLSDTLDLIFASRPLICLPTVSDSWWDFDIWEIQGACSNCKCFGLTFSNNCSRTQFFGKYNFGDFDMNIDYHTCVNVHSFISNLFCEFLLYLHFAKDWNNDN